jgi:ABC-type cobalamin transport system permease subunit
MVDWVYVHVAVGWATLTRKTGSSWDQNQMNLLLLPKILWVCICIQWLYKNMKIIEWKLACFVQRCTPFGVTACCRRPAQLSSWI